MGAHLIDGEFQSDKYPTCPRGKVPLSTKDPTAQDLLWTYAQRRRSVDAEFSADLEAALIAKGFIPMTPRERAEARAREIVAAWFVIEWTAQRPRPAEAGRDALLGVLTTELAESYSRADAAERRADGARDAADFQGRVRPWMLACFGPVIPFDKTERNHRFIEEALELVQALGCTADEAHQLVDYVYGRPVGEPHQEVGGVMITLAALCIANDMNMQAAGETELARIWTKVDLIRAKQAAKPKHSPLPEAVLRQPAQPNMGEDGARIFAQAKDEATRIAKERGHKLHPKLAAQVGETRELDVIGQPVAPQGDPDAETRCADDKLPGTADEWREGADCDHSAYSVNVEGRAVCDDCGHRWTASAEQIDRYEGIEPKPSPSLDRLRAEVIEAAREWMKMTGTGSRLAGREKRLFKAVANLEAEERGE